MMQFTRIHALNGAVSVPGDKSISHRAVMLGSLSNGLTEISNFLQGEDCLSTIACFRRLGIVIKQEQNRICIRGKGLRGLSEPDSALDVGNSGTTARLLSGILAPQSFCVTLTGDASIQKRPMKRIMEPLSLMGAQITSLHHNDCAPLQITGTSLHGISYISKVASAQVKSAILLAGLFAEGETSVTEPTLSRNHSEIMLRHFGAKLSSENTTVTICPAKELYGRKIAVPGDISSAAYFIAAGLLVPNSELLLKNVGINPTRDGILTVAKQMGGDITYLNTREEGGEASADILVRTSSLHGITIEGALIPTLIDELPVIAVMAAYASGTTVIKDAAELKVKESNRIDVMVANLSAMGAQVHATEDGMLIEGGKSLHGAVIDSHADHRIAMSFAVAALLADGTTEITDAACVRISYPSFYEDLQTLSE